MKAARKTNPRLSVVRPVAIPAPVRAARNRVTKAPVGVVDQVREALKPKNRIATFLGFALGGFVPLASYVVAHYEIETSVALYAQLGTYLVLGGLLYSAKTVYDWGLRAFSSAAKAVGFVVLLEGVMVAASSAWLGAAALGYLIVVNGIATGCNLSARSEGT